MDHGISLPAKKRILQSALGALCSMLYAPWALAAEEIGSGAVTERLRNIAERGAGFVPRTLPGYAGSIVRGALVAIGLVFFVLMVYGGFLYLTAGGNEEQVTKSKAIMRRAVIGLLVVIFAGAIVQFFDYYLIRRESATP